MSEQKALYKYEWDFDGLGKLSGIFLAPPSQVEAAIGKGFDFGAVFGPRTLLSLFHSLRPIFRMRRKFSSRK